MRIVFSVFLFLTFNTLFGQITLVKDLRPGENSSSISDVKVYQNQLIFLGKDDSIYKDIFVSDGTEEGTEKVVDLLTAVGVAGPQGFTISNDILYFSGNGFSLGDELYRTDGTEVGTYLVKDINPGPSDALGFQEELFDFNGLLFLNPTTEEYGRELWVSDGTDEGTTLLKDIVSGESSSVPSQFFEWNDKVFFSALGNTAGEQDGGELWVTDGTSENTFALTNLTDPSAFFQEKFFTPVGDYLYFILNGTDSGRELYRTDGTLEGTTLVIDLHPGDSHAFNTSATDIGVLNGELFFSASAPGIFTDLWKTDGTEEGTVYLRDFVETKDFTVYNNELYFFARDVATDERGLWKTDGTVEGIEFIRPFDFLSADQSLRMLVFGEELIIVQYESATGVELYTSDGTTEGTVLIEDLNAGEENSTPSGFIEFNNTLYFTAFTEETGRELFKYKKALSTNADVTEILCHGEPMGSIELSISGGEQPYTIEWSDEGEGVLRENLIAGEYIYTVTDASGVEYSETIVLTQPTLLQTDVIVQNATGSASNGSIDLILEGGTPPYNVIWSTLGLMTEDVEGVAGGTYPVSITDANGCNTPWFVFVDTETSIDDLESENLYIYPNPAQKTIFVKLLGNQPNLNKLQLTDATGRVLKNYSTQNQANFTLDLPEGIKGIYFLKGHTDAGIWTKKVVVE